MNTLKCCVIVPTYNNHKTLKRVLDGVLLQTKNVIVVNDGSTDATRNILSDYSNLVQIHLEKTKAKEMLCAKVSKSKGIKLRFCHNN